jgi:SAM-dependent methyltransferase
MSDTLPRPDDGTLAYYNAHSDAFWAGTRDHDVRQNIASLLSHIEHPAPLTILDLGCGPGRDLRTLSEMGHVAIGLDGAATFVAMARAHSGCDVWLQNLLQLDLPAEHFDGIFANAVLFHVPTEHLPRVLRELRASLRKGGVLFASNPHGDDEEGWNRGRYGVYHAPETWNRFVSDAGFALLDQYYRPPGLPRAEQPWHASVWRRID